MAVIIMYRYPMRAIGWFKTRIHPPIIADMQYKAGTKQQKHYICAMTTKEIIAFIESKRIEKALSKTELCERANVNVATYWRYLKGLEPPFCTVCRLIRVLGYDIAPIERTIGFLKVLYVGL